MRVKLEDVCDRGSSNFMQKDIADYAGDYPIYGAAGYIGNVNFYHQDKSYIAVVKDGAGIGRTMLLPGKSSVIGTLQYLRPRDNVKTDYLNYAVQYMHLKKYSTGATIPHIYFRDYKNEEFNLASLGEQELIVDVLNRVRDIIDQRLEQLKKLDNLIKSRFVEMFGDPVLNTKKWKKRMLSDYIIFLTSGSRGWATYFSDEGEMFITIKNVKNNMITTDNVQYINAPKKQEAVRTKVKENDLLISITADLGRTGVVSKEISDFGAYINQHLSLVRLDTDKVDPTYISYYLETEGGRRQFETKNQSAVKAGLNFEAINSLQVIVPPIKLQKDFVSFVHQVDKLKIAVQKSLDEMQLLFDSLMQQYFG